MNQYDQIIFKSKIRCTSTTNTAMIRCTSTTNTAMIRCTSTAYLNKDPLHIYHKYCYDPLHIHRIIQQYHPLHIYHFCVFSAYTNKYPSKRVSTLASNFAVEKKRNFSIKIGVLAYKNRVYHTKAMITK